MNKIDDGGCVYPIVNPGHRDEGAYIEEYGLTKREWFAAHAPEPTKEQIEFEGSKDQRANPHGDVYKPSRRSHAEVVADLRFKYADEMIAASKRDPR